MPADTLKKSLLGLLSDQRFHSGTEVARRLGVSRTTVWNAIRELESQGVEIAALPGKGYRVKSPLELLSESVIRRDLSAEAESLLASLEIHDELDSTNSYLMRTVAEGARSGTLCLAEVQTAGRGRIGRTWVSPCGANIYLSILWRFEDPTQVAGLSLAMGVGVVRALNAAGCGEAGLKWPNDVLFGDRKLGGILLEMTGEAYGQCVVVVGLGINRYIPPEVGKSIDQAWTDLSRVVGTALPSRNRLIASILNEVLPLLRDYPRQGLEPYLADWHRFHRLDGREATIYQGDDRISGKISGITAAGLLILQCDDGVCREFASGDVRLRTEEY